jgi:hypothetical protein
MTERVQTRYGDGHGFYWVASCAAAREGDLLVACECGSHRPAQMAHGEAEWHPPHAPYDLAAPVQGPICVAHERPWPCRTCEGDLELADWWEEWRGRLAVAAGIVAGVLVFWAIARWLGIPLPWGRF